MKKFIVSVFSLAFLFGAVSFVSAKDNNGYKDVKKAVQEMNALVEKYNKASDKKKPAIEKEIKAKVSANYDKHLKQMEERTAKLEERVTEMKAKLARMKTEEAKNKHIDEVTKKIISGEKPMLFRPPWDKDGEKFKGPKHHGMKGPWHKGHFKGPKGEKGMKGEKENCPCAKGEKCPFTKDDKPLPPKESAK